MKKRRAARARRLIVADPRRNDLGRYAWRFLQFKAGPWTSPC